MPIRTWTLISGLEEHGATELSTNQARIGGAFLPSGGIAIADVTRVLFGSASGRVEGRIGRAGGGPGEFREIDALCATRGDTVVVSDGNQNRLTVLAPPARLVRVVTHDLSRSMKDHSCFADGRLLIARGQDQSKPLSRLAPFELDLRARAVSAWPVMQSAQIVDLVTQPRVSLVTDGRRVYFADGQRSKDPRDRQSSREIWRDLRGPRGPRSPACSPTPTAGSGSSATGSEAMHLPSPPTSGSPWIRPAGSQGS